MVFEKVSLVNGGKLVFVKVILEFGMKIFQRDKVVFEKVTLVFGNQPGNLVFFNVNLVLGIKMC